MLKSKRKESKKILKMQKKINKTEKKEENK